MKNKMLLSIGGLTMGLAFIFQRYLNLSDLASGVMLGAGIGCMLLSVITPIKRPE
jgi:hypothetical protein